MDGVYLFERPPTANDPGGMTVSKTAEVPSGDYGFTEFTWHDITLWFIDEHEFTADEREAVFLSYALDQARKCKPRNRCKR